MQCEACGKSEEETLLLHFPYTVTGPEETQMNDSVDEDAAICFPCAKEDYKNMLEMEDTE